MEIPDKVRVRLVFKFDNEETYRKFYWFEMNKDELYWGSPGTSKMESYTVKPEDGKLSITIPENFDNYPTINSKVSYHQSGEVHIKKEFADKTTLYDKHNKWPLKSEIIKPTNIFSVVSKALINYNDKIDNPDKRQNHSLRFQIPEGFQNYRFYMECFLCPEGKFEFPNPLLVNLIPQNNITSISLSKKLILVIRFALIDSLGEWQSDVEINLIPDKIN